MALLEHNIRVYDELEEVINEHGKAMLVTATGTGKSYVTIEYLDRHDFDALVICPRVSICDNWERLSDRVKAMTYSGFAALDDIPEYPVYVFDEAHHAGAKKWGRNVKRVIESGKVAIGLTADPVRWTDGEKNVGEDLFEGAVVYGYSLEEAVSLGILPSFTYICTLSEVQKEVEERRKIIKDFQGGTRMLDSLMSKLQYDADNVYEIKRILKKHLPENPKGVVFVEDIAETENAVNILEEVTGGNVCVVNSKVGKRKSRATLREFEGRDSGFCVAVNMLNEGVHIKGINVVIMFRRTSSPHIFFQQLGRGTAVQGKNATIFDFVGNRKLLGGTAVFGDGQSNLANVDPDKDHEKQIIVFDYAEKAEVVLREIDSILNGSREWSAEEDAKIKKWYPIEHGKVRTRLDGRTREQCVKRAKELGIDTAFKKWTSEEDEILQKWYPTIGGKVRDYLPNRTEASIRTRCGLLGIKFEEGDDIMWTQEEDEILKEFYPTEGRDAFRRLPKRSPSACAARCVVLRIHMFRHCYKKEKEKEKKI